MRSAEKTREGMLRYEGELGKVYLCQIQSDLITKYDLGDFRILTIVPYPVCNLLNFHPNLKQLWKFLDLRNMHILPSFLPKMSLESQISLRFAPSKIAESSLPALYFN